MLIPKSVLARLEITYRPDLDDPKANRILRQIELLYPKIRKKIRWARYLNLYWVDLALSREEGISVIREVLWDPVLQWVFSGNLMPASAGKSGGLVDLLEHAPIRPGRFCGVEKRYRPSAVDRVGRTLVEAFKIVVNRPLQVRASSGGMIVFEGPDLEEDALSKLARNLFCREHYESWTLLSEEVLKSNDRFHQERVKYDLPKGPPRSTPVSRPVFRERSEVQGNFGKFIEHTNQKVHSPWCKALPHVTGAISEGAGAGAPYAIHLGEERWLFLKGRAGYLPTSDEAYGATLQQWVQTELAAYIWPGRTQVLSHVQTLGLAPFEGEQTRNDEAYGKARRQLSIVSEAVRDTGQATGVAMLDAQFQFQEEFAAQPLLYTGVLAVIEDPWLIVPPSVEWTGLHVIGLRAQRALQSPGVSVSRSWDICAHQHELAFLKEVKNEGLLESCVEVEELRGLAFTPTTPPELLEEWGGCALVVSVRPELYEPFARFCRDRDLNATLLGVLDHQAPTRSIQIDPSDAAPSPGVTTPSNSRVSPTITSRFPPPLPHSESWRGREGIIPPQERLIERLANPNHASHEILIREWDREVGVFPVLKPFITAYSGTPRALSSPNDAILMQYRPDQAQAIAVSCCHRYLRPALGSNSSALHLSPGEFQQALDEAVRRLVAVGLHFGLPDNMLGIHLAFWAPHDSGIDALLPSLKSFALGLDIPILNIESAPELRSTGAIPMRITSVGVLADSAQAKSADFKAVGDVIYWVGIAHWPPENALSLDWGFCRRFYAWFSTPKIASCLKSLCAVKNTGILMALSHSLFARQFGAQIEVPSEHHANLDAMFFGIGHSSFILSVSPNETVNLEAELSALGGVCLRLGTVSALGALVVRCKGEAWLDVPHSILHTNWTKPGYWV